MGRRLRIGRGEAYGVGTYSGVHDGTGAARLVSRMPSVVLRCQVGLGLSTSRSTASPAFLWVSTMI